MKSKQARAGFTLIELLVVIAIIAILASLLMAGLSRAKMQADLTVCKNNLRQIALGSSIYTADFHAFPALTDPYTIKSWFQNLEGYVGARWPKLNTTSSGQVLGDIRGTYACPSYSRLPGMYFDHADQPWGAYAYNDSGVSFAKFENDYFKGLAGAIFHGPKQEITFDPTRESEIVRPVDMIAFGDSLLDVDKNGDGSPTQLGTVLRPNRGRTNLPVGIYDPVFLNQFSADYRDRRLRYFARRHGGRFNISFVDSHVEGGKMDQFFQIRGRPDRARRWNADFQPHLDKMTAVTWPAE
jgi:prepilin-type N-terminal cleavage/methylation domain-containing protein/prepilin-type processing-associated H-X9-DG protein